jgi:starch phosphorylase
MGLLYRHGYFQQTINADGLQQHTYPDFDFNRLPLRPVATATGREVIIRLPMPGRDVAAKVWLAQVGRVPLLLLDTELPENHPADRSITNILYVSGREIRLVQELLLGMGGVRALEALGSDPCVWHLNEGHSAFLQLQRWRSLKAKGLSTEEAWQTISRNSVFTTHTPVPAGNEQFAPRLIEKYLDPWCEETEVSRDHLLDLGRAHDGDDSFNLTALGIKSSSFVNGVSRLNAEVASKMWRHLLPTEGEELPIKPITNGVHSSTWIGLEIRALLEEHLGRNWQDLLLQPERWEAIRQIPPKEIWAAHQAQKERLGRFTRQSLRIQLARHGGSPDELRAIDGLFDRNALTIGFARRFATYKRANLIFSDLERLKALLGNEQRPLQIIFAGKAHPADMPGQELIQSIFQLSRSEHLAGRVFFLENYDMRMGAILTQGVDIWLNTPRRPLEASGTSGQKAAANGGLNFSILDGWWPEGYNGKNGWVIGSEQSYDNEEQQDHTDADSFYSTLESAILPLYYTRDRDDVPLDWSTRMKESIATLTAKFSASRMVRDYVEMAYAPAALRSISPRDAE